MAEPEIAEVVGVGRYAIAAASSVVDPFNPKTLETEKSALKLTEISKLKAQVLCCKLNARLMAVNLRYIIYSMKEGQVRVINQNGQDMFKLVSTTRARNIDLAVNGNGTTSKGTTLLSLDEEGLLSIYLLDATSGAKPEDRARRLELVFPEGADKPTRVLANPVDTQTFLTLHATHVQVWSLSRLTSEVSETDFAASPGFTTFKAAESSSASVLAKPSSEMPLLDFAVSLDGKCLLTLGADGTTLTAFHLAGAGAAAHRDSMETVPVAQQISLDRPSSSLRIMGDNSPGAVQLLIAGSSTGCDLRLYQLSPRSAEPVGAFVQAVRIDAPADAAPEASELLDDEPVCRIDVDSVSGGVLGLGFTQKPLIVLFPLAIDWAPEEGLPLPYAQRFPLDAYTSLMVPMTGKSVTTKGHTVFLYRCQNIIKEGSVPRASLVVSEVMDRSLVAPEPPVPLPAPAEEAAPQGQANGVPPADEAEPAPEGEAHAGAAADSTGEEDAEDAAASAPAARSTPMDRGFVKHIAAGFVRGLEKRRGELADRIVAEVAQIVKQSPAGDASRSAAADLAVLEQALAKLKEARAAQAAQEKNLQYAAKRATEAWSEASQGTIAGVLQRELAKVSDGVASSIAQQLAGSRKFCEALARGVQKSGGVAAKQALEAMRPARQLQETVGSALTDALNESLADVFRQELRQHFMEELAPLLGRTVGDMMKGFHNTMGDFMANIADEHEKAAKRLGSELGPVVQAELEQVERVVSQQRADSSAHSISEAQLDELTRAVQAEVVLPMQTRIKELTATVQALRAEAQDLERRWQEASAAGACSRRSVDWLGATQESATPQQAEAARAAELQRCFESGSVEDAFSRAMDLQKTARHEDFLGRLCGLVQLPLDEWLAGGGDGPPLGAQAKMSLMLALSRQMESGLSQEALASKVAWVEELFYAFDPGEPAVASTVAESLPQLAEVLERTAPTDEEAAEKLKRLRRSVKQASRFLQKGPK